MKQITAKEAREAINRLSSTEDGQIFLSLLCHECGFFSNIMSMDDPNITQVYAAKRGVYAKLRKHINPEHLLKAEYKIQIIKDEPEKKDASKKG